MSSFDMYCNNIGNVIAQEKEKNSVPCGQKYKGLVRDEPLVGNSYCSYLMNSILFVAWKFPAWIV